MYVNYADIRNNKLNLLEKKYSNSSGSNDGRFLRFPKFLRITECITGIYHGT